MDVSEVPAAPADWNYPQDHTRIDVTDGLVRQLLAEQFADIAGLPLHPVGPRGTDNAMFKLGNDLVVRVPRRGWSRDGVAKEARWLPELASHLPVPVPEVVAVGAQSDDDPWTWAIYRWIPGERPPTELSKHPALVEQLGHFLAALGQLDVAGGPVPGPHNGFRGDPPAARDRWVRPAILSSDHSSDRGVLIDFWEHALALAAPHSPPRWLHGDLTPSNLVVADRRVAAVIDWGCLAVGDSACDLMIAWNLDESQRAALREQLAVDDETWACGRAAAFWQWIGGRSDTARQGDRPRRLRLPASRRRHPHRTVPHVAQGGTEDGALMSIMPAAPGIQGVLDEARTLMSGYCVDAWATLGHALCSIATGRCWPTGGCRGAVAV